MSVRRLAEDSIQPPAFAFSEENLRWAEAKIAQYPTGRQQSAVIPVLWRAQEQEGWVTRAAIEGVANMLGMPYIRVLEVATFYTQFLLKPVGSRAHVQVCGTTPCMLQGAEGLIEACQHRIHHDPFMISADGTLSWEEVECLGACVNAPMVMIGKDTYEDLTVTRFAEILEAFSAGRGSSIPAGTQIDRIRSAPASGPTTLLAPQREMAAARSETPSPAAQAAAAAAPDQEPTKPGRMREETEEGAPALKGPGRAKKVSEPKAEAARAEFNERAGDGTPNTAMREGATGAESAAGKTDGGKAPGKPSRSGTPAGAAGGGTAPQPPGIGAEGASPSPLKPTAEKGGTRKPRTPKE